MTTEEMELLAPIDAPGLTDGERPTDPPTPDESTVPRRRRWLVVGGAAVTVFAIGWGLLALILFNGAIERIPPSELAGLDPPGAGPVNYLLVGTDSREGLSAELGDFFGDFGGERADVIMLLHVDEGRLQMVSLPRDLRVSIPGQGTDRVNAAYAYGGPDLLVRTVKELTGLPVHHYLEVRFTEFAAVVDALGGVTIDFPYPARDQKSGLSVEAGTRRLDGAQAVAYVRSRSLEELRNGAWVMNEPGDIARTGRQQAVVDQLLGSAAQLARFPTLPFTARSLGASLRADEGLSVGTLARFVWAVATADVTETATLPTRDGRSGGVAYLDAVQPAAGDLLARFGSGAPLAVED